MTVSILIIFASSALLVYWFRYICLLILDQRVGAEHAANVAATGQFGFVQVQRDLEREQPGVVALSTLHTSLDRDYKLLCCMLGEVVATDSIERTILSVDYKIMSWMFNLTASHYPAQARRALGEMAGIVSYFAAEVGQGARS
ncbi:MAG: hypothetical protein ABIZ80_09670 [Bryobacteraceae bacterium]